MRIDGGYTMSTKSRVHVVEEHRSERTAGECRRVLVGPGWNQLEPFPGYIGFVGWVSPCLLRNGDLLVTFSAGYWHASPATPLKGDEETIKEWKRIGMPDVDAPTGGRAMIIRSSDGGRTFSKPETLIDTPHDDRHPNARELEDGTIMCSFFAYEGVHHRCRANITRSFDGGKTWEYPPRQLPSPMAQDATDGPFIVLQDGSVLLTVYGAMDKGGVEHVGVFRTRDSGETWELVSVVKTDHVMCEPGLAQLPDGRLVMIARPEGDICWSDDNGETWTAPVSFGMRMYEPGLIALKDGTLVCVFGTYNDHDGVSGLQVVFSRDGGETWVAPAEDYGFTLDADVYGYGRGIELPDGSIYVTYQDNGAFTREQVENEKIHAVRFCIREDGNGIEILPPDVEK